MQDAKAGTLPADPLMQALLDQYLKRVTVNRATLGALFRAADSDTDSLIDRPQCKAALTVAQSDASDTLLTTIWLEREKVCPVALCIFVHFAFQALESSQLEFACINYDIT